MLIVAYHRIRGRDTEMEIEIKRRPEDFVVEEISSIERNENGKYTIIKFMIRDWDTNKFLITLARTLRISRKRITYAGTKDKNAVKIQYFCINAPVDAKSINIPDANVIDAFRSDHFLKLGDLEANRFTIKMYGIDNDTIRKKYNEMMENGGFPNYFGVQRFGSFRKNTHEIGRLIVMGEYEKAVEKYIYDEKFDTEGYRREFIETRDYSKALKEFPARLGYERALIAYYGRESTFKDAFSTLPRDLSIMFVHAFQSYIYNRFLEERIKLYGLKKVIPGDTVYRIDSYFNPDKEAPISVNTFNLERIQQFLDEDKVAVSLPVVGYEVYPDRTEFGDIESRILEEEKVSPQDFRNREYPYLSSKGDRRIISAKPVNFKITGDATVDFILGKGIYATTMLSYFGDVVEVRGQRDYVKEN